MSNKKYVKPENYREGRADIKMIRSKTPTRIKLKYESKYEPIVYKNTKVLKNHNKSLNDMNYYSIKPKEVPKKMENYANQSYNYYSNDDNRNYKIGSYQQKDEFDGINQNNLTNDAALIKAYMNIINDYVNKHRQYSLKN